MIEVRSPSGLARIVQHQSELPELPARIDRLYADCETRAPTPDGEGLSPYQGARSCGWAVAWDDSPSAYYVPIRHRDARWNVPEKPAMRWLSDAVRRSARHVNHNVKFDSHFMLADGIEPPGELVCTLSRSKMVDSDRQGGHGLKSLARDWLGLPMTETDRVAQHLAGVKLPRGRKCRDFSVVPGDVLGEYACADVLSNRLLDRWLLEKMEPEQAQLWETETKLTSVLLDMEVEGLRIDRRGVMIEKARCLRSMLEACERVKESTGVELVDSSACFYEIIVVQLGLPVLGATDGGNPSFDAEAMALYENHPLVVTEPKARTIISELMRYRTESRFMSLYLDPFENKLDARGYVHPRYNQLVRTGRMSCSDPNGQQLNPRAKSLIVPADGEAFFCSDASQIEFRIIVHYVQDAAALAAYASDPRTDFHSWVGRLCGVARDPAKTLNFAIAYGAGKRTITAQLMSNEALVRDVLEGLPPGEDRPQRLEAACFARATDLYERYHFALPGIKATARTAERLARERGFIRNAYGRKRHLPASMAHKAFNTLGQGCAMDFIKERMVALSPRFNSEARAMGLRLNANVHDEVLGSGPLETVSSASLAPYVEGVLSAPSVPFRVPLRWKTGTSDRSWKEAKP